MVYCPSACDSTVRISLVFTSRTLIAAPGTPARVESTMRPTSVAEGVCAAAHMARMRSAASSLPADFVHMAISLLPLWGLHQFNPVTIQVIKLGDMLAVVQDVR